MVYIYGNYGNYTEWGLQTNLQLGTTLYPPARPAPVAPVAPAQPPSLSQAAGRVMRLGMAVGNKVPWGWCAGCNEFYLIYV